MCWCIFVLCLRDLNGRPVALDEGLRPEPQFQRVIDAMQMLLARTDNPLAERTMADTNTVDPRAVAMAACIFEPPHSVRSSPSLRCESCSVTASPCAASAHGSKDKPSDRREGHTRRLVRSLFGFVEDAINVLFVARRKAMQPCKRQLFLQLHEEWQAAARHRPL